MENRNIKKDIAFAFICEPGELEIKSAILAYSLRKIYNHSVPVFALIPIHHNNSISGTAIKVFNDLSVTLSYFKNPITEGATKLLPGLPMCNKIFGLRNLKTFNEHIVFLDSDIICLNYLDEKIFKFSLSVKSADFSLPADWNEIYKLMGVQYPKIQVITTVDGLSGPPYYNTGVIAFDNSLKDNLCNSWEHFFRKLSSEETINKKLFNPYHTDQVAFAMAVQRLEIFVNNLTEKQNFPARRRDNILDDSVFAHYHDCQTIAKHERLKTIFFDFIQHHPEIKVEFCKYRNWRYLCEGKYKYLNVLDRINRLRRLYYKTFRFLK